MTVPLSEFAAEITRLLAIQRAALHVIHQWQRGTLRGLPGHENEIDLALLALRESLDRRECDYAHEAGRLPPALPADGQPAARPPAL